MLQAWRSSFYCFHWQVEHCACSLGRTWTNTISALQSQCISWRLKVSVCMVANMDRGIAWQQNFHQQWRVFPRSTMNRKRNGWTKLMLGRVHGNGFLFSLRMHVERKGILCYAIGQTVETAFSEIRPTPWKVAGCWELSTQNWPSPRAQSCLGDWIEVSNRWDYLH